jgi:hypothetical protein
MFFSLSFSAFAELRDGALGVTPRRDRYLNMVILGASFLVGFLLRASM